MPFQSLNVDIQWRISLNQLFNNYSHHFYHPKRHGRQQAAAGAPSVWYYIRRFADYQAKDKLYSVHYKTCVAWNLLANSVTYCLMFPSSVFRIWFCWAPCQLWPTDIFLSLSLSLYIYSCCTRPIYPVWGFWLCGTSSSSQ